MSCWRWCPLLTSLTAEDDAVDRSTFASPFPSLAELFAAVDGPSITVEAADGAIKTSMLSLRVSSLMNLTLILPQQER